MWWLIFSELEGRSVCSAALACKFFYGVTQSESIWQALCIRLGQNIPLVQQAALLSDVINAMDRGQTERLAAQKLETEKRLAEELQRGKEQNPQDTKIQLSWKQTYAVCYYCRHNPQFASWAVFGGIQR